VVNVQHRTQEKLRIFISHKEFQIEMITKVVTGYDMFDILPFGYMQAELCCACLSCKQFFICCYSLWYSNYRTSGLLLGFPISRATQQTKEQLLNHKYAACDFTGVNECVVRLFLSEQCRVISKYD